MRTGEGIAFAGLCGAAAWLEISGKPSGGLWVIVGLWAFCRFIMEVAE